MNRLICHGFVVAERIFFFLIFDSEKNGSLQTALGKCWIIGLPARYTQLYSAEEEANKRHSSVPPDPGVQRYYYGFSRTVAAPTGATRLTDISV
jgi:hypothetical protein